MNSANQAAKQLLIEHLSPVQVLEFIAKGRFKEGVYEILAYRSASSVIVGRQAWCAAVVGVYPVLDQSLGVLLLIRSNRFFKVAAFAGWRSIPEIEFSYEVNAKRKVLFEQNELRP